jgi:hypothetical protein
VKRIWSILLGLKLIAGVVIGVAARRTATAQQSAAEREKPIALIAAIPLPRLKEHFASGRQKLFVAALGNNSAEVIDIETRTLEHTISGEPHSQGLLFSPEANELFVASDEGKLYI